MMLEQAIAAAGMTPPRNLVPGKWLRFPGIGKGKSNRAGWCRVISPTLAIFGDWSRNFTATWRDDAHRDDAESRRLLVEARKRERAFIAAEKAKQAESAKKAVQLIHEATVGPHPYLEQKGFDLHGLIHQGRLVIPVRDADDYSKVISAQLISADGDKKFLTGGRTRAGIHRLGSAKAVKTVLCEGYATGLTLDAAMAMLPGPHAVIVCFSARNLELVAKRYPSAAVATDNDVSATGEQAAKATGLRWTMPYEVGTDFDDLRRSMGIHVVVERMRELFQRPQ